MQTHASTESWLTIACSESSGHPILRIIDPHIESDSRSDKVDATACALCCQYQELDEKPGACGTALPPMGGRASDAVWDTKGCFVGREQVLRTYLRG